MRRSLLVSALFFGGAAALAALPDPELHPRAQGILAEQVADWRAAEGVPASYTEMRGINAEWDFMGRTFMVLSLMNLALEHPEDQDELVAMADALIQDTLAAEAAHGQEHFLMPYGRNGGWLGDGRSLFVDGEIAMMMAARRVVNADRWGPELGPRIERVVEDLDEAALAESYPDEGWLFCHSMALAALRMHDHVEGTDHSELAAAWLDRARRELKDEETGLLVSSFTVDGRTLDGPEGSSIFLSATNLMLVRPDFAQDQYDRAAKELGGNLLGFGYAREWPASAVGHLDVDSGPLVPVIDASPSASGFFLLASRAFDDRGNHRRLVRALDAADAVIAMDPEMAAMADNPVGDAVLLYAFTFGPLWAEVGAYPVG